MQDGSLVKVDDGDNKNGDKKDRSAVSFSLCMVYVMRKILYRTVNNSKQLNNATGLSYTTYSTTRRTTSSIARSVRLIWVPEQLAWT